jgi:hypothetical protein
MSRSLTRVLAALTAFMAAGALGVATGPGASAQPARSPANTAAAAPSGVHGLGPGYGVGYGGGYGHRLRIMSGGWSLNSATANNFGHGRLKARTRTALVQTRSPWVNATNQAVARSRCSDCRTVAVALEVVVASGSPPAPSFTNYADARSENCNRCETLAMAYQLVLLRPASRLSNTGVARLNEIAGQLASLTRTSIPIDQVAAGVDGLAAQAAQVLSEEVVEGGGSNGSAHRALRGSPWPGVTMHRWVDRDRD